MSDPLREAVARARHDLGKYVAMNQRWLGDAPPASELREALVADLLETRSGPRGKDDAVAVWAALRPDLEPLAPDADLAAVDAHVAAIAEALPALASGALPDAALAALAAHARAIPTHLTALNRRLKER